LQQIAGISNGLLVKLMAFDRPPLPLVFYW